MDARTHGLIDFLLARQSSQQLSGRSLVCQPSGQNRTGCVLRMLLYLVALDFEAGHFIFN